MTREIQLTQGLVALVDDEDYDTARVHKWYAHRDHRTFYAVRKVRRTNGTQAALRLHTFLTGWPMADHINGNGLDNQRSNLRPATNAENMRNRTRYTSNTSGFKGVTWHKQTRKWQAQINIEKRSRYLGLYDTPETAALAYDAAARQHHGDFATVNFPQPGERAA